MRLEPRLAAALVQQRLFLLPFELSSPCRRAAASIARRPVRSRRFRRASFSHRHGARSVPATTRSVSRCSVLIGVPIVASTYGCATDRLVLRRDPRRVDARRAPTAPGQARDTRQTARRRATLRAREQRQKRAAGRMRPSGAAIEPRRHSRAAQRMLEQTEIAVRLIGRGSPSRRTARLDAPRCRMRRAISTDSRPSPGAENTLSEPSSARSTGGPHA